ncbi:Protein-L-isoaspartate(D-aspartate) O-methyltransferase [Homalodisca vitripennis]|nr:Protein-L-isoaspartate(D-aspartate) O-methyltransferase [Homalodisca vitripennis]
MAQLKLSSYIDVPIGLEAAYRSRLKILYLCKPAGFPHLAKKIILITLLLDLVTNKVIRSDEVESVMSRVDRGRYVTHNPYMDAPQGIGYGVTISAPHMHAYALELLRDRLTEGERALDVGSGSGYLTVCMALMVGETGRAVGIDHIPELVNYSYDNVMKDKPELLASGRVKLVG